MLSAKLCGSKAIAVHIECDSAGMEILLTAMARLIGERASHVHLRSPAAGGKELDGGVELDSFTVTEIIIDFDEGD